MQKLGPLVRVKSVKPLKKYDVQITFQNDVIKKINLEPFLRSEIFAPLRENPFYFRSVNVMGSTIGWDNGADIDPYALCCITISSLPGWKRRKWRRTKKPKINTRNHRPGFRKTPPSEERVSSIIREIRVEVGYKTSYE